MGLLKIKIGDEYYYRIHEDKETPDEIKEKLLKGNLTHSFYADPYRYYKIIKE